MRGSGAQVFFLTEGGGSNKLHSEKSKPVAVACCRSKLQANYFTLPAAGSMTLSRLWVDGV